MIQLKDGTFKFITKCAIFKKSITLTGAGCCLVSVDELNFGIVPFFMRGDKKLGCEGHLQQMGKQLTDTIY